MRNIESRVLEMTEYEKMEELYTSIIDKAYDLGVVVEGEIIVAFPSDLRLRMRFKKPEL